MKKRVIMMVIWIMSGILLAGCGENTDSSVAGQAESVQVNADAPNYSANEKESEDTSEVVIEENVEEETEMNIEEEEKTEDKSEDAIMAENHPEEPFGTPVEIDRATQKKMNIFLSNFSEAGLRSYDKDAPDYQVLAHWAHIWFKINKYEAITYENRPGEEYEIAYEKISLDEFNRIFDKYLGFEFTEDMAASINDGSNDAEYFFYENGYFYAIAADGESYTDLSIVTEVQDLGDNRLKLCYGVYSQDLDAYFDDKEIDYSMTGKEAEENPEYELMESGYAIVRIEDGLYKLEYLEQQY